MATIAELDLETLLTETLGPIQDYYTTQAPTHQISTITRAPTSTTTTHQISTDNAQFLDATKKVKRLWNHVFQYHLKQGNYTLNDIVLSV